MLAAGASSQVLRPHATSLPNGPEAGWGGGARRSAIANQSTDGPQSDQPATPSTSYPSVLCGGYGSVTVAADIFFELSI